MKSPRIASPARGAATSRLAVALALLTSLSAVGGCKMSPAMEARSQARQTTAASAPDTPASKAPLAPTAAPVPPVIPATAPKPPVPPAAAAAAPRPMAAPPPTAAPPPAPPPSPAVTVPTPRVVATPAPPPAATAPGAAKTADRGDRKLGPTPIGQVAPEEAPTVPAPR